MIIRVNQELCAGCGVCVDACSVEAIQLVDYRAKLDDVLCTQCGVCMDVCPNGAIHAMSMSAQIAPTLTLPAIEPGSILLERSPALPVTLTLGNELASLAETALSYFSKEILPSVLDNLVAALERRLASSPDGLSTSQYQPVSSPGYARANRSGQMQRRRRSRIGRIR